jgi:hypothetical protein
MSIPLLVPKALDASFKEQKVTLQQWHKGSHLQQEIFELLLKDRSYQ